MATSRRSGTVVGSIFGAGLILAGGLLFRRWHNVPAATKRVDILDVPVDPLTMTQVLARIDEFIHSGQPHHIFTADASGIMRAQEEPALLEIVRQADLVTPDGAGVLLAGRMRGLALPERVSGVDLVEQVSHLAATNGYSVYLFGAADGIAQATAAALQERYPGLTIAGVRHGFFDVKDEATIVRAIAKAAPHVLFVGLGIPKQEVFINKYFTKLGVPVMVGIGGSFDVISGRLQRAPHWMQRAGLEWLYRLAQEPHRFPRLAALPKFITATWKTRNHDSH